MTFIKVLIILMFSLLYREAPAIKDSQRKVHVQHKTDVVALGGIFTQVGKSGVLVNSSIDPIILASMSYEESRYRQHGADGDVHFGGIVAPTIIRRNGRVIEIPPQRSKPIGNSIGPMQISRGAPYFVKGFQPKYRKRWEGLTVHKLRNPATNVKFAYTLLERYKEMCGGSTAVWIDAYGRGKCPTRKNGKYATGRKANLRCKRVDWFVSKMSEHKWFTIPENWSCRGYVPPKPSVISE